MAKFTVSEAADLSGITVSQDDKVIRNVVLLGPDSPNGGKGHTSRRYEAAAMLKAVPLYEGKKAFFNHVTEAELVARGGGRDVRDIAGYYKNVRFDASESKLRGDFHLIAGPHQAFLLDIAANSPNLLGLSHDAQLEGNVEESTQTLSVKNIRAVNSVDVVDRPATTKNLFESRTTISTEDQDMTDKTVELTEAKVSAERERDSARKALEAAEKERDEGKVALEAAEAKTKAAETVAVVERLVGEDGIPDLIAKRVRKLFEGKTATEAEVKDAIDADMELVNSVNESRGSDVRVERLDVKSTEAKQTADDVADGHRLAESAFGAVCGADFTEKTKDA